MRVRLDQLGVMLRDGSRVEFRAALGALLIQRVCMLESSSASVPNFTNSRATPSECPRIAKCNSLRPALFPGSTRAPPRQGGRDFNFVVAVCVSYSVGLPSPSLDSTPFPRKGGAPQFRAFCSPTFSSRNLDSNNCERQTNRRRSLRAIICPLALFPVG